MKSACYLFNLSKLLLDFDHFNLILIIFFLSFYILLCIFNASSTPRCNDFILCKAL